MKTLMIMMGLAYLASPAQAAELQYWVDEATHKIHFVARPQVAIQISHVGADDDYWDLINVDVGYSNPKMEEYVNRLKAQFPGYELSRLILGSQGDFKLSIPVLQIDQAVQAMPGVDGPWMQWQAFIPRLKSEAVRRAIAQSEAVTVSASASVTYRMTQTLERYELSTEICQELRSREGTLFGAIRGYGNVLSRIEAHAFRYPGTKQALIRSVFESCLDLPSDSSATSFRGILDVRVEPRRNPSRPFGETRGEVPVSTTVPLQMDLVVNMQGGRS